MTENNNVEFTLNDQAKDFLLYAYFGIVAKDMKNASGETVVQKDTKKAAIRKCVDRAYLDMCRTLSLKNGDSKNAESPFRKKFREEIADKLSKGNDVKKMREAAYKLFFGEGVNLETYLNQKEYADKKKRNDSLFYYGQFQKWINMSLKYMWLIGLLDSPEGLEVPLDRYILKAASEDLDIKLPRDNGTEVYTKYTESSTRPWSKLNMGEYNDIQRKINDSVADPIAWECDAWIIQAKLDNKKEQ